MHFGNLGAEVLGVDAFECLKAVINIDCSASLKK